MEKQKRPQKWKRGSFVPAYTFECAGSDRINRWLQLPEIVNITDGVRARFVDAGHLLGLPALKSG